MEILQLQKAIKELVAKDELSEALDKIIEHAHERGFVNLEKSAIIHRANLDRIDREKRDALIAEADYTIVKNQTSSATLDLVNDLSKEEDIPDSTKVENARTPAATPELNTSQKELKSMIISHDKIFMKIILLLLAVSIGLFIFYMTKEKYSLGGVFFTSSAGTWLIYLDNKKRMLKTIYSSL